MVLKGGTGNGEMGNGKRRNGKRRNEIKKKQKWKGENVSYTRNIFLVYRTEEYRRTLSCFIMCLIFLINAKSIRMVLLMQNE